MTQLLRPRPVLKESAPVARSAGLVSAEPVGRKAQSTVALVVPYLNIARPDHWFKNVFMVLGVLLAYFYHPEEFGLGTLAWIAWAVFIACLAASSNYVINEILDAPTDRSHPVKRNRPVPSGRVWLPLAYAEWIFLVILSLGLASTINWPFAGSILFLLVMGLIYNVRPMRAKEHPYVDVLCESINNPIRLLLGWFAVSAAEFPPVSLLIAYWMIGAFFMATKRLAEYRSLGDPTVAGAYRRSFRHYNEEKLLVSIMFYTTSFALFLGVFTIRYHLELILIFPLVAGFVCYYLRVALKKDSAAQNPERLYREKSLMAYLVLCVAAFGVLMFVRIPPLYRVFNVRPSQVAPLWKF